MNEYDTYLRAEWELFVGDPARGRASLDAACGLEVVRVLDVGCGAGQELLPFVIEKKAFGVGLDMAPEAGQVGRSLYASRGYMAAVAFVRGSAESLPFDKEAFDVIICRIALPYMDNRRALGEIARVLRHGGVLLLKIHHPRFYLRKLGQGLASLNVLSMIHAARVLTAGTIYHLFRKQPRNGLTGGEAFQTAWLLKRELMQRGLSIVGEMPDSNPATPSFIISSNSVRGSKA